MGTIARGAKAGGGTNFISGQTIDPAEVNTDFNTIVTEINGGIDNANIETGTIPGGKSLRFTGMAAPSAPSSGDVLVYLTTGGILTMLNSGSVSTALGAGRGEVLNLKVVQTSGSEAASVTITADAIDIDGARATSVNVAASLAASGAGGLDTGAEANDTHYYLFLIRKSSDGTVNGLLSVSSTAPTMPSGYDQKRLIGHRRNDGSGNMIRQVQSNDLVLGDYAAMQVANAVSADGDMDLTTFVPVAVADCVYIMFAGTSQWEVVNKTDSGIQHGIINVSAGQGPVTIAAQQSTAGLISLDELAGTATVTGWLAGWKVKVL